MLDYIDSLDFVTFISPVLIIVFIGWLVLLQGENHVRPRND